MATLQNEIIVEDKRKHLEFIQSIVSRMSQNSFLIKGWAVTLISALFALAEKESNQMYIIVAYFPTVIFWLLDSYFIYQERLFRKLYNHTRQQTIIDFSLSTGSFDNGVSDWSKAAFSKTVLIFYIPLIVLMLLFLFVLK